MNLKDLVMDLSKEIEKARHQVQVDSYPMSIGEMINLYKDGELDIHPEFQRIYRWTDQQKSKLIESILLGIPLPSIFVAQRSDGVWDVVDGLQRLSTIFSFVGILRQDDDQLAEPLELNATKFLPSLKGKVWEDKGQPDREIDIEIKRVFKREKLDLKIIKRESKSDTKLELFQRLNTGGTKLSDQEVRNCMLLMINKTAFDWLQKITKDDNFISTISISEKVQGESYDQELALRFIVQRHINNEVHKKHTDIHPYLDAEMSRIFSAEDPVIDYEKEKALFHKTFRLFNLALEDNAFRKYNQGKERHEGAFNIGVFEALATGVSFYIEKNSTVDESEIVTKIRKASEYLTSSTVYLNIIEKSARPLNRMVKMIKLGQDLIK